MPAGHTYVVAFARRLITSSTKTDHETGSRPFASSGLPPIVRPKWRAMPQPITWHEKKLTPVPWFQEAKIQNSDWTYPSPLTTL